MVAAKQASIEFAFRWQSAQARHRDRLYFESVNFWRDFFPGMLADRLAPLAVGESASEQLGIAST